jgi:hypothetical protein
MKFIFVAVLIAAIYSFVLLHTTDIVLNQTQQLSNTYQYVDNHADQIATGQ